MKTFLLILKRILSEKYSTIEFDFYLSSRLKNVHMGFNCNLLLFSEHDAVISDIENIWMKREDTKFKVVLPCLIHTTKWKFDYIIFRRNIWLLKRCPLSTKDFQVQRMFLRELTMVLQGTICVLLRKKNLKPWSNNFILVDLCMAIPEGYYGRVVGHSGSAKKYGIMLHNGAIDSDYWRNVGVILFNFSNEEYVVERGDRIAQMIVERYGTPKFVEVHEFAKKTERGECGFGSTGVWFSFIFFSFWIS